MSVFLSLTPFKKTGTDVTRNIKLPWPPHCHSETVINRWLVSERLLCPDSNSIKLIEFHPPQHGWLPASLVTQQPASAQGCLCQGGAET